MLLLLHPWESFERLSALAVVHSSYGKISLFLLGL
jgi:hypothetical protein